MKRYLTVDDFIFHAPLLAQPGLHELRQLIRVTLPQAQEKIWYGVPFYHEGGEVAGFSLAKQHISLGVGAGVLSAERRKRLAKMGYRTGSCTIQIRFDQKPPAALIREMLVEKVKWNRGKK